MRYKPYVLNAIRREALNIPIHGVPFKAVRLSRDALVVCNALYTLSLNMNYKRFFKLSTLNFTPIS